METTPSTTPEVQKFDFPASAYKVLDAIEDAGFEAWFVGGCVRDTLMERDVSDVDIASSATWRDAASACEALGMTAHATGAKHGTVTIACDGEAFEVTTFRIDSVTSADARHPDSVEFTSSIEEDLARRDFTVNAIAWHPDRGLLDPYNGRIDIEHGLIRAIGDPRQRFREDALRILRACRFASQLGFSIDQATYEAMLSHKFLLARVSTERVARELDLFVMGEHVHDALMATVDVLEFVMPELAPMKGCEQRTKYHCFDVLEHTAWAVQLAERDRMVKWAALCHDMGKPAAAFLAPDGTEHFYGHAWVSANIARGMMRRLMMPSAFADSVCAMIEAHSDKIPGEKAPVKRALSRIGDAGLFRRLLALKRADMLAHAPEYREQAKLIDRLEDILDEIVAEGEAFTERQLDVDGHDVMELGVEPGPDVGRMLSLVLDAVIDETVENSREDLLEFMREELRLR